MKKKKVKTIDDKLLLSIRLKRVLLVVTSVLVLLLASGLFLLYGPNRGFRDLLIVTAYNTKDHHFLADWFYNKETIKSVLGDNGFEEVDEDTNEDDLNIGDIEENFDNEFERQLFENRKEDELYRVIPVSGSGWKGYITAIYDPSKVKLGVTRYLGKRGESTLQLAQRYKAHVVINAGGFYDPDWNSAGGVPHGVVIQDGKVVWEFAEAGVGGGFIGFDKQNRFILGRMTKQQALDRGMRDAVQYGPFLIVNGKATKFSGSAWGIAPRTAVGQRQDGVVLFLAIDGRRAHSLGANMNHLTETLINYGAYNAANMDGGSSTSLIIEQKVYNNPVAGGPQGLRSLPMAWIVVD